MTFQPPPMGTPRLSPLRRNEQCKRLSVGKPLKRNRVRAPWSLAYRHLPIVRQFGQHAVSCTRNASPKFSRSSKLRKVRNSQLTVIRFARDLRDGSHSRRRDGRSRRGLKGASSPLTTSTLGRSDTDHLSDFFLYCDRLSCPLWEI